MVPDASDPAFTDRFQFEKRLLSAGCRRVAGVDEAGRGPLAGPVVAAAVVLPISWIHGGLPDGLSRVDDSKKLTARQRERLFEHLIHEGEIDCGIAEVSAREIDRINILRATHRAMAAALRGLSAPPDHVLVDGLRVVSLPQPQTALVGGDARSVSIAAASILAKVTRDRIMRAHAETYPEYGFARHKGYGTAAHRAALARSGPCPIHRRSFAPLRQDPPGLFEWTDA